ncbi:hypothetical protein CVIRNUC_002391 [Coccomyxa viridis]|uniref:Protein FAM136A n=1 Tax=Coccomyxa viridis TaxID=1274662 RepID=A0AAV1HVL0_9CHLO|nr:hypothetical protein CVIRNUC_002391 [Coccomyxa viridis]
MEFSEIKAQRYQQAIEAVVRELQKKHLNPAMKESFLCSAECIDGNRPQAEIERCLQKCQAKPTAVKEIIEGRMKEYQARMQRCLQRCQDQVQESVPSEPSEKDIQKAQGKLAVCFANCAEEYEGKLDKLKVDIAADLSRLTSRLH